MKITDRLKKPDKLFSFEFYPPKTMADAEKLFETVKDLKSLGPDFISITNSSSGSAPYRTVALSGVIKEKPWRTFETGETRPHRLSVPAPDAVA